MTHEICSEPRGATYHRLLQWCGRRSATVLLVCRPTIPTADSALQLLGNLAPFKLRRSQQSQWPGTELLDDTAEVFEYRVDDDLLQVLHPAGDRLYCWTQPALPEDLCFLKRDGSTLLETISHERAGYLRLDASSLLSLREAVPLLRVKALASMAD